MLPTEVNYDPGIADLQNKFTSNRSLSTRTQYQPINVFKPTGMLRLAQVINLLLHPGKSGRRADFHPSTSMNTTDWAQTNGLTFDEATLNFSKVTVFQRVVLRAIIRE